MYSARDNKGHLKVCLTLIFKVNYYGQVTYVSHFEFPNIGYKFKSTQRLSQYHVYVMFVCIYNALM